jgi:hypothetical protein
VEEVDPRRIERLRAVHRVTRGVACSEKFGSFASSNYKLDVYS